MTAGDESAPAPLAAAGAARPAPRTWRERLLSPAQGGLAALLLVVVAAPLFLQSLYHYDLAILVGINASVVIALNLLVGYAGQISLGHAAFFALGAYGSAVLAVHYQWPPLLALLASVTAVGVVALVIARPILRLKGYYLGMATLGLGMIVYLMITTEARFTGGPDGMSVPMLEVFGYGVDGEQTWYWVVAVLTVLVYLLALNIVHSPVGRALRAVHGSEIAATTAGIDVTGYKVLIFVVSAVVAALMGALYAFYSGFITPSTANFMHSIEFVVMVVFGGMASLVGSVVGAVILTLLPQYLTTFSEYEWVIYGLILMLVMIFMPKGLVPTLLERLQRRKP